MHNIDWSPLFNGLIALAGVILTAYIIPLLKQSLSSKQLENVRLAVNTSVRAAEMLFSTEQGEAKKKWVLDYLASQNIVVDEKQLNALIEEAVYELNKDKVEDKVVNSVPTKTEELVEDVSTDKQ